MDRSQYLVQALQSLGQAPAQAPSGPDLQQLAKIGQNREAFEAANPGQSYAVHGMRQMGQNLRQAPQAMMDAPGNAMTGLGSLARNMGLPIAPR